MNGYKKFSVDLKEHYAQLEEPDWVSVDQELKDYVEVCYPKFKEDLSVGEKVDFWKHTFSYALYRGEYDASYKLDLDIDLEAELNEISLQGQQEIERYIQNEIKPELENVIDDVLKEVESLGEKLKEWLKE